MSVMRQKAIYFVCNLSNPTPTLSLPLKGREIGASPFKETEFLIFLPLQGGWQGDGA